MTRSQIRGPVECRADDVAGRESFRVHGEIENPPMNRVTSRVGNNRDIAVRLIAIGYQPSDQGRRRRAATDAHLAAV
jgi:hypothetical protein